MRDPILSPVGAALRAARRRRGFGQADLAARVGRPVPRISELETGLLRERIGRDRLSLLAEICDALDLALLVVPREALARVESALEAPSRPIVRSHPTTAFDDLFVDLSDEAAEGGSRTGFLSEGHADDER